MHTCMHILYAYTSDVIFLMLNKYYKYIYIYIYIYILKLSQVQFNLPNAYKCQLR